ncbi:hypothetical protein HZP66_04345 [Elizabethkingia anophelis]|uniref:hypothetical protein n=1 Tax=Elizabethkingia anophelis TaxID=1117645 RepID=UPI0038925776|nr:hypothetical protein [Elizabethkingia anophelis]
MKTLLLNTLLICGIAFGQSKDLSKKQALEGFKKSQYSGNYTFENAYKTAKCFKIKYKRLLKDMPIFQKNTTESPNGAIDFQFGGTENLFWMKEEELNKMPCFYLLKETDKK